MSAGFNRVPLTWETTGDERLLAYENALHLHGLLTDALNTAVLADGGEDLDAAAYAIASASPIVLGERSTVSMPDGRRVFTVRQAIAQAEMLNALLPDLAAEAFKARREREARQN